MAQPAYPDAAEAVDPRFGSVDCVFFVIGAQKAGTTWLSKYLGGHPDVSVPEWKEHDYWNMVEGRPKPSRMLLAQRRRRETQGLLRRAVERLPFTLHARRQRAITLALRAVDAPFPPYSAYADVILECRRPATRAAGEICPEYALLTAETYRKMAALSPNVRFVFLMRDPVRRFISGVRHGLRKKLGARAVSEAALSEAIDRFCALDNSRPMALSRYDRTILTLEQSVDPERILYVFFEDLFDQATVKRICAFLGIGFVPGAIDRKHNRAGAGEAPVRDADRRKIARALAPVYAFASARFGDDMPAQWRESAALC
jgi:hypothetical protein